MRKVLFSLFMMCAVLLAAVPAHAADIDGKWSGSLDTPMGAVQIGFNFKADGATLTGTMTGPDGGDIAIKNGKIDADKISFVVSIDVGGMALDLNYTGVLKPETAQMMLDVMGMPFSFEIKKAK